jgi:hypothetical protein
MIPAMPRVLLVALASLVLLAPSTGRAKCAMPLLAHQIVTHAADEIPAGGGVLVGWTTSTDWDSGDRDSTDPAARAGWRLRLKKTRVATTMEQLAPGLARYAPAKLPKPAKKGKPQRYDLLGDKGKKLGSFTFGRKKLPELGPAPGVASVDVTRTSRGRGTQVRATVTLDAAPPADAHALVVRTAGGDAFAWGPIVDRAASTITVFDDDGRCEVHPPGMRAPGDGEQVEAFWVDRFGRKSPASAAVTARAP